MERIDYYQIKSKTIFGKSYIGNYSKDTEILKSAIENFFPQNLCKKNTSSKTMRLYAHF